MTLPLVESTDLLTAYGPFTLVCFSWGPHEEDNILCLAKEPFDGRPTVRVQSACYTAEIFRSLDCDCHEQLVESLKIVQQRGGLLIYMLCDGRGAGLLNKVRGLGLGQSEKLDTSDAYDRLGLPQDPRRYDRVVTVIQHFPFTAIRLLTNNPRKVHGLHSPSLDVYREPLEIQATEQSAAYLQTKARKMGHLLQQFDASTPAEETAADRTP